MVINRGHAAWCLTSLGLVVVATGLYIPYANNALNGATGNSITGLLFGVTGTLAMIFAGLLAARKRIVTRKLGSISWWLKGHLWVGLVSVPLIFFHSGFRFGGLLEQLTMWCFLLVIISGVIGQVLQHVTPRFMKTAVPQQAIFEQVEVAINSLKKAADTQVLTVYDTLFMDVEDGGQESPDDFLRDFYLRHVRTFLQLDVNPDSSLLNATQAEGIFATVREGIPRKMVPVAVELESICNERRQLISQNKLQWIMHGWTLIHIPLSMSLLILTFVHVIMSLYF
ncbi:MAG: hypothetical protein HOB73_00715 [Planctomycetaceae bacterium]|nr:hypothetical protein [Planctomycetaceae bacterium]MBT7256653.1 hypothetical protein [Planctomycetaceae bacterium]